MKDNKLANITLNAECQGDKDKVSSAGKKQIKMFETTYKDEEMYDPENSAHLGPNQHGVVLAQLRGLECKKALKKAVHNADPDDPDLKLSKTDKKIEVKFEVSDHKRCVLSIYTTLILYFFFCCTNGALLALTRYVLSLSLCLSLCLCLCLCLCLSVSLPPSFAVFFSSPSRSSRVPLWLQGHLHAQAWRAESEGEA